MRKLTLGISAAALLCVTASVSAQPLFNPTFDTDVGLWNASPFLTVDNTITWNSTNDHTGNSGGSIAVFVLNAATDNTSVSSAIDGAVQFNGLTTLNSPATLDYSAYVFVDTPLTEAVGISGGNGGAAVALIDGAVDFTGTITPDANRILDNAAFEQITCPTLTLEVGKSYSTYLLVRNASGTAYFDDLTLVDGSAGVEDWDIYAQE